MAEVPPAVLVERDANVSEPHNKHKRRQDDAPDAVEPDTKIKRAKRSRNVTGAVPSAVNVKDVKFPTNPKLLDRKLVVEGVIAEVTTFERKDKIIEVGIVPTLESDPDDPCCLRTQFQGTAGLLLNDQGVFGLGSHMRLSFKESVLVLNRLGDPLGYPNLVYERGAEFWIRKEGESDWTHYRTFKDVVLERAQMEKSAAGIGDAPDTVEQVENGASLGAAGPKKLVPDKATSLKEEKSEVPLEPKYTPRHKQLADLRAPEKAWPPEIFDCVVQAVCYLRETRAGYFFSVADYTINPSFGSTHGVDIPGDLPAEYRTVLQLAIWKDDAPPGTALHQAIHDLLTRPGKVVCFKGLAVKAYKGCLEAHGALKYSSIEIEEVPEHDPRHMVLMRNRVAYMEKLNNLSAAPQLETVSVEEGKDEQKLLTGIQPAVKVISKDLPPSRRSVLQIKDLREPTRVSDPKNFFDCVVEVMEDVEYGEGSNKTVFHVTDYTDNPLVLENRHFFAYPLAAHIQFDITVYDSFAKRQLVSSLSRGNRIFLGNVRVKPNSLHGTLEGHVGTNGELVLLKLDPDHPAYIELQKNREALEKALAGPPPKKREASKFVRCDLKGPIQDFLTIEPVDGQSYRLRGRVVDTNPGDLDSFLATFCGTCQKFLKSRADTCTVCSATVLSNALTLRWRFGLQIELESPDMDIEAQSVNKYAIVRVFVDEVAGETSFMNGLEPAEQSLGEAKALLSRLADNPDPDTGHNPIFEFAVVTFKGVNLMTNTILVR